ncbi:unnamed protein product [Symbiodinium microadriaticum]|nr:unnamed protein product [Symbiodinium sp. KB8]CAE7888775.1 unnamed protein product [Symbiodinium microadriaticum]
MWTKALLDRPSTDLAAVGLRTSPADVDQKLATALLIFVTQAAGFQTAAQVASTLAAVAGLQTAGYQTSAQASILALQGAGPFASATDLDFFNPVQSAIDAVLAQLAVLVGARTLRRLHATAPLSISHLALSIACDSYSTAEADAAIAAAIAAVRNGSHRGRPGGLQRHCGSQRADRGCAGRFDNCSITAQMDAAIAAAVAGLDLSPFYTSAQTDAAILAALVPVALSNAPAWAANPPTCELLKGTNVLRNLHFAGPLLASLQNNTDTLQIECEVNTVVSGAIDALNITQYQTVDAEIAANSFNASDYYTKTQSDSRYFVSNANAGNISLIRDAVTPPTLRVLIPRAPLSGAFILGNAGTLELNCDCYSKSESDGSGCGRSGRSSHGAGSQPSPADISVNSVSAAGDWLSLVGGTAGTRIMDSSNNNLITVTTSEAVFPPRLATPELAPSSNTYMRLFTGTTALEVADQSLNPLLQVEDDETKSLSRVLSVTRAATGGVVGAVLKNTAGTGWARLQLDANGSTGFAQLEVGSTGDCVLYAPDQVPQNLSDSRVKTDIEAPGKQIGFIAAEVQAAGKARVDALDKKKKPKGLGREPPNLVEPCVAAMDLRLGDALTNQRGGKFLPAELLCWNTTQWAEILYEPSPFGKGEQNSASERVSLVLELTSEMQQVVSRLEKQAETHVAAKNLDSKLQTCMKQTRNKRECLKPKANLVKVRFWDADGNRLMNPPAELKGRKALVAVEVRQLWIMGQQCGLLMEVRDIKLQDASPQQCPL